MKGFICRIYRPLIAIACLALITSCGKLLRPTLSGRTGAGAEVEAPPNRAATITSSTGMDTARSLLAKAPISIATVNGKIPPGALSRTRGLITPSDFSLPSLVGFDAPCIPISAYGPIVIDGFIRVASLGAACLGDPGILNIHGGAWIYGDATAMDPAGAAEMAAGIVYASVDYTDGADMSVIAAQVDLAFNILRQNAAILGIDPSRMGVLGESAGGQLALVEAVTNPAVRWAGSFSGPTDMTALYNFDVNNALTVPGDAGDAGIAQAIVQVMGGTPQQIPGKYALYSAADTYLVLPGNGSSAAYYIASGTADAIVPFSSIQNFVTKIQSIRGNVFFRVIPGGDHGAPWGDGDPNSLGFIPEAIANFLTASPSSFLLGPPFLQPSTYSFAFQANTDLLWTVDNQGNYSNTGLGMKPGTSPAITSLATGGHEIAFQANTGFLWTSDNQGNYTNTGLGMDNSTSPSITALPTGYEIAFQANTGTLWTTDNFGHYSNTNLGMWPRTSPSIAPLNNGTYEVAFQANTGFLWVVDSQGHYSNTGLGMWPGTSPSIAGSVLGGYEIAFEANTGFLWIVDSQGHYFNTGLGMQPGTSPSIAPLSNGGFEIAFQANTGFLWVVDNHQHYSNTGLGMWPGTSPSVAGLTSGGYQVAFEANTGTLWTVDNTGSYRNTNLGMATATSPAAP